MSLRRMLVVLGLAGAFVVATPVLASAHPLGNFTVNHYAGLRIGRDKLSVDYVVDMAEIPTFQTRPDIDRNGDDRIDPRESRAYERSQCPKLARGLHIAVDGSRVALTQTAGALSFPPGQAGLPTMRLECRLEAVIPAASSERSFTVVNSNPGDRIGWREITAIGDGTALERSPVPTTSITQRLTKYPADRLKSPLDDTRISLRFKAGGAAAPTETPISSPTGSVVRGFDSFTRSFTSSVVAKKLTLGLALVALAIGLGLGALHAFAPGHGKTVMAAYLVGERGTVRDGLLIGVTVAATHTVGVLMLGGVLTASQAFAPEQLYPWLALTSGVCFAALGLTLLVRAVRRRRLGLPVGHHHHGFGHHDHDHHHDEAHDHDHAHDHDNAPTPALSRRSLLTLGFAGGLVPTPTAIVVLLGATAIGRAWFGVLLVLAYGVGMAATLVTAGLLLARARRRFDLKARGERLLRVATLIPIGTAAVVTGSGLWLVARAATSV